MAYLLIAVGLFCLIAGIVLFTNAPKTDDTIPNNTMNKEEVKAETTAQPTAQSDTSNANEKDESYEKGEVSLRNTLYHVFPRNTSLSKSGEATSAATESMQSPAPTPIWSTPSLYAKTLTTLPLSANGEPNIITRTKLSGHIKTNWHVTVNLRKRRTCPSSLFWALAALLQPRQKSSLCLWLPSNM